LHLYDESCYLVVIISCGFNPKRDGLIIMQALHGALTKLHLRHKGGSGKSNGDSDSSHSSSLQLSEQQQSAADLRPWPSNRDAVPHMGEHTTAGGARFDYAPASDAMAAVASADAEGFGGLHSQSGRVHEGGSTSSRPADVPVRLVA
jgi:hypothetical protein